ncbi:MAG: putative zinc-binding metallopeptidase [Myxococcota bacterium]
MARPPIPLGNASFDEILDLRFCDLGLTLEGTWVEEQLERLFLELEERDLRLRPHFWLADEWFSPDHVPGIAIPFYLAHPRLMRVERKMMYEVEGGTRAECMKLLRHEAGHAVQHGYRLHLRRRWQKIFGKSSEPYPDFYRPRPGSRRFVHHLDGWYAQSHPVEDFAETFAVWLTPRSGWRSRYAGWPALRKLEYVDELMAELAGEAPPVKSRQRPYAVTRLRHTLREHYEKRMAHYRPGYTEAYDHDLTRLFSDEARYQNSLSAATFIRRHRPAVRRQVADWTGAYQFTIDQVLKEMIGRCRFLQLRLTKSEARTRTDFAIMLTVHTVNTLRRGHEWHPL